MLLVFLFRMACSIGNRRYALAYKGLTFTTQWYEWHKLGEALKAAGAKPTSLYPDGEERYTTPTIHDSLTGQVVSEAIAIGQYLDATYPDTANLFPPGATEAIKEFDRAWHKEFLPLFTALIVMPVYHTMHPESRPFFRRTREKMLKCKMEDYLPEEKRPEKLEQVVKTMSTLARGFDQDGIFFLGDTFSYADCVIGGYMIFAKKMLRSDEWAAIANSDGGRWVKILEYCEGLKGVSEDMPRAALL